MLDFDEILLKVKDSQIRKYLKESIKSYQVGNYRSAILAVWVATMFNLVKKFEILVEQREPTAIKKWEKLKLKIEAHQNWEQELIDAAKEVAMISRYEADTLKSLSKTRNRYAHPAFDETGDLFDPTPEEVRYFIRTLYEIVLSQPAQLGAFYVNQLLQSIQKINFFPDQPYPHSLTKFKEYVIEKVNRTNSRQIPRLIKELFKSLASPHSKEHEINILCFLINIWGAKNELQFSDIISNSWNEYILEKRSDLNIDVLQGILNYPECINELSDQAQGVIKSVLKSEILPDGEISRKSAAKFLAAADTVSIAKDLLDEASHLIQLDDLIELSLHYNYLFGNQFSKIFGQKIFEETRRVLKTRDGYQVNPALAALRQCPMWDLADTLPESEQVEFANELITSLNSNNYGTMNLLSFNNREEIPIKWVKLLLDQWSTDLSKNSQYKKRFPYYLENYLGLVERYTNELGNHEKLKEVIQIIVNLDNQNHHALEHIAKLEANETIWMFWQKLIEKYSSG